MKPRIRHGIFLAILAAALYALNSPFSKLLLQFLPSTLMAGFLYIGAARTSACYAVAPFIGVFLSLLIFREFPGLLFAAALFLMIIGAWLSSQDKPLRETFHRDQKHLSKSSEVRKGV